MQSAIKKAVDGGWKHGDYCYDCCNGILLDPLFWQALGKACGWKTPPPNEVVNVMMGKSPDWTDSFFFHPWLFHWHRFIDHLAEGKDVESFFNELLK